MIDLTFRCFQRIGQPEQVVLFRQLAGTRTPEVIQLAGQLRADAQLASLFQSPGLPQTRFPLFLYRPCYLPVIQAFCTD
ncbi:hypothetical protein FTZ03_22815 [Salmonella enterica]|nr:hypothetical protein [Salmonella enterica]